MKFAEALPGLLVVALRFARSTPRDWAGDWIAVMGLLWMAVVLTREESRSRRWAVALGCVWLAAIYAVHQGPHTIRFG